MRKVETLFIPWILDPEQRKHRFETITLFHSSFIFFPRFPLLSLHSYAIGFYPLFLCLLLRRVYVSLLFLCFLTFQSAVSTVFCFCFLSFFLYLSYSLFNCVFYIPLPMLCVIIPIFRFDYIHRFLRLHPIYALKPARLIDLFKPLLPSYFYVYPMPFTLLAFIPSYSSTRFSRLSINFWYHRSFLYTLIGIPTQ